MLPTIGTPHEQFHHCIAPKSSVSSNSLIVSSIPFPSMGEAPQVFYVNGFSKFGHQTQPNHGNGIPNHEFSKFGHETQQNHGNCLQNHEFSKFGHETQQNNGNGIQNHDSSWYEEVSKFGHETQQNNGNGIQNHDSSSWYEEVIDDDLKWSFKLNRFVICYAIHYSKSV